MQVQQKMEVYLDKEDLIEIAINNCKPNFKVDRNLSFVKSETNNSSLTIHLIAAEEQGGIIENIPEGHYFKPILNKDFSLIKKQFEQTLITLY